MHSSSGIAPSSSLCAQRMMTPSPRPPPERPVVEASWLDAMPGAAAMTLTLDPRASSLSFSAAPNTMFASLLRALTVVWERLVIGAEANCLADASAVVLPKRSQRRCMRALSSCAAERKAFQMVVDSAQVAGERGARLLIAPPAASIAAEVIGRFDEVRLHQRRTLAGHAAVVDNARLAARLRCLLQRGHELARKGKVRDGVGLHLNVEPVDGLHREASISARQERLPPRACVRQSPGAPRFNSGRAPFAQAAP